MPELSELRRQSKNATYLTIFGSLVVLAALLFGYRQTNQAQRRVDELKKEQGELNAEINLLTTKRDVLKQEINVYLASNDPQNRDNQPLKNSRVKDSVDKEGQYLKEVSGHRVSITIKYARAEDKEEGDIAEKVLQSYGYAVTGVNLVPPYNATHETTVRFFRYDRSTVAVGRQLVAILKKAGFTLRTEFDDEFVGSFAPDVPPPGSFEFWIGKNPSYKASK